MVNRTEKEQLVTSLHDVFSAAELVVIVQQSGMTVAESTDLRRKMREAGAGFKVAKNRLTRLALKGTSYESLGSLFNGPTAIAYSEDPVSAAKVVVTYAKDNDKIAILGGGFGKEVLDASGVKALASLPSLDELRTKIVCLLNTPATRIAGVLQAPAGQVARVIGAYGAKDAA
ncbi:MAG: 50S ribosomal protein L10 [Alphaproteobacteria bacterium]|nr:50S ribosomal protein L10 [Alphaproteobacteria bacterium]